MYNIYKYKCIYTVLDIYYLYWCLQTTCRSSCAPVCVLCFAAAVEFIQEDQPCAQFGGVLTSGSMLL